ncbi:MAG: EAL domain-containing protein [Oleispira sp.]|nr:EAL domain-containing protein [Oleispira sp.]
MKLLSKIKNSLTQDKLKIFLFASWCVLALVFIIYATSVWFTSTNNIFIQLDTLNKMVSKNTQLQANHLFLQLEQLNQQLLTAEKSQKNLTQFFTTQNNNNFDHRFIVDSEGKFILSTFRHNNSLSLNLDKAIISQSILKTFQQSNKPGFVPTFSLGPGSSSQYVTICMSTQLINSRLLCIALSTENEKLNWNQIIDINNTALRVIAADSHLLYSAPLPIHKRSLLGKKIPTQILSHHLSTQKARNTRYSHFQQQLGFDDIKRMGSIQFLADLDMFIITSMPTSHAVTTWIEDVSGPLLMLLLFYIISFLGYYIASYNFNLAKADYLITESALREQEGTLNLLFSNLPGMIYRVRIPDYKVLFITDGCQDLLGYSANSYLSSQRTPFDDIHEDDQDILIKHADSIKNPKNKYEHIFRIKTPSGELKWIMDRGCSIQKDKNHIYLEGILLDITEHMISQQQVEYLATRDPLTELANRYLFNDELINHIDRFRDKTSIALLFIDLDRFKTINDSLGHQVGDRLLKLVAERLQECINDTTLLARLGGDEFMIMMTNPSNIKEVEALAHSINDKISKTYELDYYKLNTSCSIGISMYPQDSTESHILLRNADTAMYSAKAKGGNRYQFYTDEMNQKVNSRLTIETELRRAIKENEFELHYQPQVNAHTGELEGAEALVRWIHPTAGMISPVEFIPVAEETGLIKDIGDWVLEHACMTFKQWNKEAELNLSVAVNVSVRQLDDSFVLRVQEILTQTGLSHNQLELEITESLLMDNVQENVRILENINRQGVRFAMDDFGTGYSSLSYLRQFPISKLKIDRSFVNDITDDPDDEAIIRAIIAMGQTLKLEVIAEGVENHQQLVLLQAMGCDSYQGYFFSKPLPAEEFHTKYIQPASQQIEINNQL